MQFRFISAFYLNYFSRGRIQTVQKEVITAIIGDTEHKRKAKICPAVFKNNKEDNDFCSAAITSVLLIYPM